MRKVSGRLFGDQALPAAVAAGVRDGAELASSRGYADTCHLLRMLAEGYRHLSMLRCREAVEAFRRLPPALFSSGWVQGQMGRCYLELVDYSEAVRCFEWMRRACPHRLEGLDLYSTALWHLRREAELSHLAQECLGLDRLHPASWVVLGNCFSLQREHESAIRLFQRALQLEPAYAYAHTLLGHEYRALEEMEKAAACYRQAIRHDPRHYPAWYGLGQMFFRQERYDAALAHFGKALELHPGSSVLVCYRGMVLARQGKLPDALAELDRAITCDPRNPLARFEKASTLLAAEQLPQALEVLRDLRALVPRESSVCFQIGRILKRLGRRDEALRFFSEALDLK